MIAKSETVTTVSREECCCAACTCRTRDLLRSEEIIKLQARVDELQRSEYRPEVVAKLRAQVALANLEARASQAKQAQAEAACAALRGELDMLRTSHDAWKDALLWLDAQTGPWPDGVQEVLRPNEIARAVKEHLSEAQCAERILFLDFDGVLNHPGSYSTIRHHKNESNWTQFTEAEWLDPVLVGRVSTLALRCRATIAVLSTWRERHDTAVLRAMLLQRGLSDRVVVESCARGCSQEEAVARFLFGRIDCGRPVGSYVVLDDSRIDLFDSSRWIRVDGAVGLTEQDAERARIILTRCG